MGSAGYVVLPGATGTLVELSVVWEHVCKGFLARRPLVCVGRFWAPLVELISRAKPRCADVVAFVSDANELGRFFPSPRAVK